MSVGKHNHSKNTWASSSVNQGDLSGTAGATYTANERNLLNNLTTAVNSILKALRDAHHIG